MGAVADLVAEYVDWLFAESPALATFHGVDGHDDQLPDLSADGFARREAAEDDFSRRFAALPDPDLDATQRIDRDLVLASLAGARITREWEGWRRNPDVYLGPALMGLFSLFARRLHAEPELARCAIARLGAVPRLVAEGRANLDPLLASPLLVRRALGQCRAGVTYSRDLLPAEVQDDGLRALVAGAGEEAAEALESYAGMLEDLAGRATGDWALGEDRYSALLRDRELLDDDAASLRERGAAAYADLDAELRSLCGQHFDGGEWRSLLDAVNADRPESPEEMRDGYEAATARARAFLVEHELVSFPPGESCSVEPSPSFQRPVLAVASYFPPPALRPTLAGRFNVPYPPEGTSAAEIAQRLADNSYPSMATTSAHEAYPGHHWHYATLQAVASPLRRLVSTPYFVEGWALYAERMMREQGYFATPQEELCHLEARIFRAARIVVDTSLHCGDMSFEDAVAHLTTKTGLTEATARVEVTRYCAAPTQAASYLTGSLEIERMRERWFTEHRGGLRDFHDRLAATGALPIGLAERALFAPS